MRRRNLADHLIAEILDLIKREQLKPGDRLPPLKTLAAQLGVATPTLREALRRLETTGTIDFRHGSGIFVGSGFDRLVLTNPNLTMVRAETVLELLETRQLLEPALAARAAEVAEPADLEKLALLLDQARRHLRSDATTLMEYNLAFHLGIAETTKNVVATEVLRSLIELYSSEHLMILRLHSSRELDHAEHYEIFEAIAQRQPELARRKMIEHLQKVTEVVSARLLALQGHLVQEQRSGPSIIGVPKAAKNSSLK
uniref:FadR family transcriptional regulator n=1 Tax=Thermomicrobium roseum TaxID=500 RepID=A0A7C5VVT1_THERO